MLIYLLFIFVSFDMILMFFFYKPEKCWTKRKNLS